MRSFKKIAAMIMAVAMLCSFTALGATVDPFTVEGTSTANPTATLKYTSNASQNTILVYKGTENTLSGANVVYIDQLAKNAGVDGVRVTLGTDASDIGTYTVMVGGTDVATAESTEFEHEDATPKYDVTMPASVENGEVSASIDGAVVDAAALASVREGTEVVFTLTPKFGYALSKFEVNGENRANGDVETFTVEVTEDIEIVIEFDRAATYYEEAYTYNEVFDVDASEDEGLSSTGENFASKIFFGKALAAEGKTIKSMGMEVYKDGVGVVTKDGSIDTKFAANPDKIINNKYGIRFYAFTTGDYSVRAYVEYADGEVKYGEYIEFTVE